MKKFKKIPKFKNEDEEREFWAAHDSTDYFDWSKAQRPVFPNLKPTSQMISLRLPLGTLDRIKDLANKKDIPYQSLIKIYLTREIAKEMDWGGHWQSL
ncbi:MAG: BrnA antitoxin family protein [Elusimicrobia bacterium]|nr:BrnA antitoxin family protein [Elusimicrobiota bacterium]